MRLADVLIPPSLDAKQALRLRRLGLATLSYVLATALTTLVGAFGYLAASVTLEVAAAFLVLNLALYAFMRSGLNLRFKDPSLTSFQILAAITAVMYIAYHMDEGRQGVLFACFIIFLFGIFRFNAREFTLVTLYTLAAYALVIGLLMQWRPLAIHDVRMEWIGWLALAGFLPCFAIIGGHINTLRRRMHESEMRFRQLSEMSSDFYWENDTEHRLAQRSWVDQNLRSVSLFGRGSPIGKRRWEITYVSPDEAGWQAHRALLDAHQAFRSFEFSRLAADGSERYISISGDPVFDASGAFRGYSGVGTDITERKQAAAALKQSEENLAITLHSIGDAVIATDAAGRITRMNPTAERLCGWLLADAIDRPLTDVFRIVNFTTREPVADPVQLVTTHGQVVALANHTLLLAKDGQEYQITDSAAPMRNAAGEITGVVLVFSDVTEKYRTQEIILQERDFTHEALDSLPGLFYLIDQQGRFLRWNKNFETISGYGDGEISTMSSLDFFGEADKGHIASAIQQVYERGEARVEAEFLAKNQTRTPFLFTGKRCLLNQKPCLMGMGIDITERKQTEAELSDSYEVLRGILDTMLDGFWRMGDHGNLLDVNPIYCKQSGYTREELLGMRITDLEAMESPEETAKHIQNVIATGSDQFESIHRRKDGSIWHVEVSTVCRNIA
ncbi:MAG: PAS domain S-box protein, partial [Sideroxyarcus sp.]|nr:PAS domain S-box protein [Sideroxyarcus sp.]